MLYKSPAHRSIALLATVLAAATLSCSASAQTLDPATSSALDAALAGTHRSDANKARDRYRHPKETLAFFGLQRDMTVVEIWPGGGWYTEVLAPVLAAQGKLYVAEYGAKPSFEYQGREMEALHAKIARAPQTFGNVTFTALAFPDQLQIAPPGSVDLVVTFRNVHNWLNPDYGRDADRLAFAAMFAALKPGGILGVVDHRWPDPATEDPKAAAGYVSEERAIRLAQTAGFELVARSDVNRNPRDTHDHPNGVWTLPPDLGVGNGGDRQKYLDIGESDRFTLKFRKPAAGAR